MSISYTKATVAEDYVALLRRILDGMDEAKRSIAEFSSRSRELVEKTARKLSRVPALPVSSEECVVVDPTKRFLSLLGFSRISEHVFYVYMKPPLIPHFFLVSSYLVSRGYTLFSIVKTSPVVSLIGFLTQYRELSALVGHFAIVPELMELFLMNEVSILPISHRYLALPVTTEEPVLYYTTIGLSTAPVNGEPNVQVLLEDVPEIPENVLSNFISLKDAVEKLVG